MGMALVLMSLPSRPEVPMVAQAATALLMQTMLPMAAPTHCMETISTAGRFRVVAVSNCRLANRVMETVAEPETKEPRTPMKGAMT